MPDLKVRRATIEDLPKLAALWGQGQIEEADLEKRFKDFQVLENETGELIGAIAIRVGGQEGMIDNEVYADPAQGETLRPQLWERIRVIAQNFGLCRIWTQLTHPFWSINGFQAASPDVMEKLPAAFTKNPQPWFFIQLRDETLSLSMDKEFALFKEAEHENTERIFRQARVLKTIAFVMAAILVGLVIVWAVLFLKLPKAK